MAEVAQGEANGHPIEDITSAAEAQVFEGGNASCAHAISHPGKVTPPDVVESRMEEVRTSVAAHNLPSSIEACEYQGTIRMVLTQAFAITERSVPSGRRPGARRSAPRSRTGASVATTNCVWRSSTMRMGMRRLVLSACTLSVIRRSDEAFGTVAAVAVLRGDLVARGT